MLAAPAVTRSLQPQVKPCNIFNPVGGFREKSHNMHNNQESVLKGQICVDGNSKAKEGSFETSANVATAAQILSILALAVADGDKLVQMNVKSTFTQVKLEDSQSIWLGPLPGFPDKDYKDLNLEFLHHLYGHPEANSAWMSYWAKIMKSYGFKAADCNDTVFYYENGSSQMHMAIIVDSVIFHNDNTLFKDFKAFIEKHVLNLSHMCSL
jgi:hypothetical protein